MLFSAFAIADCNNFKIIREAPLGLYVSIPIAVSTSLPLMASNTKPVSYTHLELNADLVAAKKELFNLRFQNATNQLENTSRIKEVKKNIARIKTVLTAQS